MMTFLKSSENVDSDTCVYFLIYPMRKKIRAITLDALLYAYMSKILTKKGNLYGNYSTKLYVSKYL